MTEEELAIFWTWRLTHCMLILQRDNLPWIAEVCEAPVWYTHSGLMDRSMVYHAGDEDVERCLN